MIMCFENKKSKLLFFVIVSFFVGTKHHRQVSVKVLCCVITFEEEGQRDRVYLRRRLHTSFCCLSRGKFDINTETTPKYWTTAHLQRDNSSHISLKTANLLDIFLRYCRTSFHIRSRSRFKYTVR